MGDTKSAFTPIDTNDLIQEAEKIKVHIREASNQLRSLDLNLGASLRLNIKLVEMEAYLSGLRYALGEAAPFTQSQARHSAAGLS